MDVISLKPGESWEPALYDKINDCDIFLLFWSSNSKASKWVIKELRHAIALKNGDDKAAPIIQPIPIEGPPIVYPPEELGHMHFNDKILYFVSKEKE